MNISKSYINGKVVPAVMSGALALSMAVPCATALAAGETHKISVGKSDTHTYEVYQLFTGDVSANDSTKLSNIKAGTNANGLDTEAKVYAAAEAMEGVVDATTDSAKLAVIEQYVNLDSTPVATLSAGQDASVAPGYYVVKDVDGSITGYDAYTLYVAKVVGSDITIERKTAVPTVTKTITDGNTPGHIDLDAGDTVNYKLSGTLPSNLNEYSSYKYSFNDTLSDGLTRCAAADVKVSLDGADVTDKFTVSDVAGSGLFTVSCDDVKAIAGVTSASKFEVTYSATVDADASTAKAGNSNKVTLTFSNNPNTGYENSTATTPETDDATVEVHTYKMLISKVDEDNAALAGAGFTLYKLEGGQYTAVGAEVTGTGDGSNQFNWTGLGTGSYKLVETTTPDGFNTVKDITFDVVTTYDGDELTGLAAANVADADGALTGAAFAANVEDGELSATVKNVGGNILPTTGTTGLIVLIGGAVLALGCAGAVRLRKSEDAE